MYKTILYLEINTLRTSFWTDATIIVINMDRCYYYSY